MQEKINEIKPGNEDYIKSILITLSSVNPLANLLATGWNEYKNIKQSKHIANILELFFAELKRQGNQIDINYLETSEAKRLLEKTCLKGKDELMETKRKMLADFLANSSTKTNAKDQEKDMILDIIDKISPLHLTLLKTITYYLIKGSGIDNVMLGINYDPDATEKPEFKYIQEIILVKLFTDDLNQSDIIEVSLIYLEGIGLLEGPSARGWTTLGGKLGVKGYRPTKLGIKILQYLGFDIKNLPDSLEIEKMKY